MMPLSYSITDAVGIGIISYCLIKIFSGKIKQVSPSTLCIYAFVYYPICSLKQLKI